ncbi:MAG: calcium-binding protein, partial [Alphaproteobacteria bacterium]
RNVVLGGNIRETAAGLTGVEGLTGDDVGAFIGETAAGVGAVTEAVAAGLGVLGGAAEAGGEGEGAGFARQIATAAETLGQLVEVVGDAAATGESGDNTIFMAGGGNIAMTGSGNDTVLAAGAGNVLATGAGNDALFAMGNTNVLLAGSGNDVLVSAGRNGVLAAGEGDDIVLSLDRGGVVVAGEGNDFVLTLGGASAVACGAGDDIVIAGGTATAAMGGEGSDWICSLGWGVFDILGSDAAATIGTTLSGALANLDALFEDASSVVTGLVKAGIQAAVGDGEVQFLQGGEGDDVLYAGFGSSFLEGGAGADTFVYHFGDGATTVDLAGGGNDVIRVLTGPQFPDVHLSAGDIVASRAEGDAFVVSFLHEGSRYGSITIDGLDQSDGGRLLVQSGSDSFLEFDIGALFSSAGDIAPVMPEASGGFDRLDQFSQLLDSHHFFEPAAGGDQDVSSHAVAAALFTNASEQALQQDVPQQAEQGGQGPG